MGSFLHIVLSILLILSYGLQLSISTKHNDPVIFVFGDSNSDTGGANAAFGSIGHYPVGNIFPCPPSERVCDGRLVVDFLCENVRTKYLDAFLNSLEANFDNGANFAISGASATFSPFRLETQVNHFLRFYNRSMDLKSTGSEQKLVGEEGFKNALYLIDIGQNDLTKQYDNASYDGMIERIPIVTFKIKEAIQNIYNRGGRKFWVHNTGPLGCLPKELAVRKPNATDLDQHGCIKYLNEGAQIFNKNLSAVIDELRKEKNDATIVYVDVYSIKYDLIANAKSYGFNHPLKACLESMESTKLCKEQSKHISWDGIHYTEAANAIIAKKIISANYSTPPLPFNFFL